MLFDRPIETVPKQDSSGGAMPFFGEQYFPSSKKLDDTIALVQEGRAVHWVSDGDWSMHDLLASLINFTGPAAVYLSSYAFSEYPARLIAEFVSKKTITELHCLIDKRLDVRSASALSIIKNIATRLELVNTHAKVTVLENKKTMVVVISSANYTTNKRYESGIVIVDREAANFHKKWMTDAFEKNKRANRKRA